MRVESVAMSEPTSSDESTYSELGDAELLRRYAARHDPAAAEVLCRRTPIVLIAWR